MLPDIDLDSESFDEILENAKNSIVSSCPEWTDMNYHDPGMTMLEMLAWLKEIQQYYLNKIGPESIKSYLKLPGIRRNTKQPSRADVSISCGTDIAAAKGTRLHAGGICFEAEERTYVSSAAICCCICKSGRDMRIIGKRELSFGGSLRINPFQGGRGSEFYVGFDKPLEKKESHRLYIDVSDTDEVPRRPITDPESFIPLVEVVAEYHTPLGWKRLGCKDGTFGFLCPGMMKLTPPGRHEKTAVGGIEAYFVRFRLTGGEYDVLPVIKSLEFGLLPVVQRETLAECADLPPSDSARLFTRLAAAGITKVYLKDKEGLYTPARSFEKKTDVETGEVTVTVTGGAGSEGLRIVNYDPSFPAGGYVGTGTGLPFQEYDLETDELECGDFSIMTELPASGGRLAPWRREEDLSRAGADDLVYVLDTAVGVIRFGDCIRGAAPEGRIYIISCSHTLGGRGNVSAGKINGIDGMDEGIRVTNTRRSEGGTDEETIEHCRVRAYRLMQTTETLITDEDHENFVKAVQGLKIETCRLLPPESDRRSPVRGIVVKPYSPDGRGVPSEGYERNVLAALEKRRMLGTGFRIVRPEYAEISVYADVTVERSASDAEQELRRVIKEYFDEHKNGFGIKLIYSKLYEKIDRLGFVLSVNTLTMETPGGGAERTREGDLLLAPNVTAFPGEIDLMLSTGY